MCEPITMTAITTAIASAASATAGAVGTVVGTGAVGAGMGLNAVGMTTLGGALTAGGGAIGGIGGGTAVAGGAASAFSLGGLFGELGTLGSLAGGVGGAVQAKQAADFQADMAGNNALIAEYQAANAAHRGEIERNLIRRQLAQAIGAGRTTYAAGNVQLGSGSPAAWESNSAGLAAEDIAMSEYNQAVEQWGYGVQGSNARTTSKLYKRQGRNVLGAGLVNTGSSLLAGFGELKMAKG